MSYPYDKPGLVEPSRHGGLYVAALLAIVAPWWIGVVWLCVRVSGWIA